MFRALAKDVEKNILVTGSGTQILLPVFAIKKPTFY